MSANEGFTGGWLPGLGILALLTIGAGLSWWALPGVISEPSADAPSVAAPSAEASRPPDAAPRMASPVPVELASRPVAAPDVEGSLRARAAAFTAGGLSYEVPEGATDEAQDAGMAKAFQVRAAEYAGLTDELEAGGAVAALADLAAVHMAFADDLEASVAPSYLTGEQAVVYTDKLATKAAHLRDLAAAAVDRARAAGAPTPAEERRLDVISLRLEDEPSAP